MMIIIRMMIASYTNDDDRHRDDNRIVHIVYALDMYDAIFFGNGRTDGQGDSRSRMIIIIMMIASYTNDDDDHHHDDCIVHK